MSDSFILDKKKFGSFVAGLRKDKGMTQKELAQRLFVSDKAVSKWERGLSVPDTALLLPLAEQLGVSATELLLCERTDGGTLDPGRVESAVQRAIAYGEEQPPSAGLRRKMWAVVYGLALTGGGIGLLLCGVQGALSTTVCTVYGLAAVFGAYFCFFARQRLPAYYDQHRISGVYDGLFRMNVPGLSFNNSNWPHILRVGRLWAWLSMGVYPLLSALLCAVLGAAWACAELYVMLVLVLGGLFVPMYVTGKRYA